MACPTNSSLVLAEERRIIESGKFRSLLSQHSLFRHMISTPTSKQSSEQSSCALLEFSLMRAGVRIICSSSFSKHNIFCCSSDESFSQRLILLVFTSRSRSYGYSLLAKLSDKSCVYWNELKVKQIWQLRKIVCDLIT